MIEDTSESESHYTDSSQSTLSSRLTSSTDTSDSTTSTSSESAIKVKAAKSKADIDTERGLLSHSRRCERSTLPKLEGTFTRGTFRLFHFREQTQILVHENIWVEIKEERKQT